MANLPMMGRLLDESMGITENRRVAQEHLKYENDPLYAEKIVAHLQHQWLPEGKAAKVSPATSSLAKIEKMFPAEDPRKTMGSEILPLIKSEIANPANKGVHPLEIISNIYNTKHALTLEKAHEYTQRARSSYFGLMPEKVTESPGYENWKTEFDKGKEFKLPDIETQAGMAGIAASAGVLAERFVGAKGLGGLLARGVAALGRPQALMLASKAAPHPVLKLALATAALGLEFYAASTISNAIESTEWAKGRSVFKLPEARTVTEAFGHLGPAAAELAGFFGGMKTLRYAEKTLYPAGESATSSMINKVNKSLGIDDSVEEFLTKSQINPTAENVSNLGLSLRRQREINNLLTESMREESGVVRSASEIASPTFESIVEPVSNKKAAEMLGTIKTLVKEHGIDTEVATNMVMQNERDKKTMLLDALKKVTKGKEIDEAFTEIEGMVKKPEDIPAAVQLYLDKKAANTLDIHLGSVGSKEREALINAPRYGETAEKLELGELSTKGVHESEAWISKGMTKEEYHTLRNLGYDVDGYAYANMVKTSRASEELLGNFSKGMNRAITEGTEGNVLQLGKITTAQSAEPELLKGFATLGKTEAKGAPRQFVNKPTISKDVSGEYFLERMRTTGGRVLTSPSNLEEARIVTEAAKEVAPTVEEKVAAVVSKKAAKRKSVVETTPEVTETSKNELSAPGKYFIVAPARGTRELAGKAKEGITISDIKGQLFRSKKEALAAAEKLGEFEEHHVLEVTKGKSEKIGLRNVLVHEVPLKNGEVLTDISGKKLTESQIKTLSTPQRLGTAVIPKAETTAPAVTSVTTPSKTQPGTLTISPEMTHEQKVGAVFDYMMSHGVTPEATQEVRQKFENAIVDKSGLIKPQKNTAEGVATEAYDKYMAEVKKSSENYLEEVEKDTKDIISGVHANEEVRAANEVFGDIYEQYVKGNITQKDYDILNKQRWEFVSSKKYDLAKANEMFTDIFKKGSMMAVATAGLTALSNLISPKDAEANPITKILRVDPFAKAYVESGLKAAGKEVSVEGMVNTLKEAGLAGAELDAANPKKIGRYMNSIFVPPDLKNVAYKGDTTLAMRLASPGVRGDILFGVTDKSGVRAMANPQVQLAHSFGVVVPENTRVSIEAFENIMKDVVGGESHQKEVMAAMRPLSEKYTGVWNQAGGYSAQIKMYNDMLKREMKRYGSMTGEERIAQEGFIETLTQEQDLVKAKLKEMQPKLKEFQSEWESVVKPLAEKYPSTRVILAAELEGLGKENPWLQGILTQEEKVAAGYIRQMMDEYALRMIDAGENPILSKAFVHHAVHPSVIKGAREEALKELTPNADRALFMGHFHARELGSKQMIPDAQYVMKDYLFDANRRIEAAKFWRDGQKGGWKEFWNKADQLGYKAVSDYMSAINKAFVPTERTTMNKAMQIYYAFEAARLIGLSVSTAFKHAVKVEANWSNFGIKESMNLMPMTIRNHLRSVGTDLANSVGIKRNSGDVVTDVMRTYTNTNRMVGLINDLNIDEPASGWLESAINKVNEKGGALISFTERFDRAHSFLAAMEMGAKRGMTAQQAAYGVMDTILKTNFMTGMHNPSWLRIPAVRTMMMFQGTPFKILEQRVLLAYRAGTAAKEALSATWAELQGLKNIVKEGEREFKFGLIKDALTSQRDIYGIPNISQFARKFVILGTLLLGGRTLFDADMSEHVMHIPGLKHNENSYSVNLNPVITAALEAKSGKDEDEYWLSSFLQHWLPSGPTPAVLLKGKKLSEDDIPERYQGSKFKYLFGIPSVKEDY